MIFLSFSVQSFVGLQFVEPRISSHAREMPRLFFKRRRIRIRSNFSRYNNTIVAHWYHNLSLTKSKSFNSYSCRPLLQVHTTNFSIVQNNNDLPRNKRSLPELLPVRTKSDQIRSEQSIRFRLDSVLYR